MIDVHARIQHHPSRHRLIPALAESLAPLPVEVVTDPGGELPSPWRCYQACLTDIPDCTHLLIVQDDVTVCRNFAAAVHLIAAANPDLPVALFVGKEAVYRTRIDVLQGSKRGLRYVPLRNNDPLPVVATLWPREKAEEFLDWSTRNPTFNRGRPQRSDDSQGAAWKSRTRQQILVTVPNLVQHPDTVSSLIRDNTGGRVAALFIGDADPLAIDWSQA